MQKTPKTGAGSPTPASFWYILVFGFFSISLAPTRIPLSPGISISRKAISAASSAARASSLVYVRIFPREDAFSESTPGRIPAFAAAYSSHHHKTRSSYSSPCPCTRSMGKIIPINNTKIASGCKSQFSPAGTSPLFLLQRPVPT